MAIPAPIIFLPTSSNYTTDTPNQTISGITVSSTSQIRVNNSIKGVSYTPGETAWSWTGVLHADKNSLEITAVERITGNISAGTLIEITLIESNNFITVSAPTGVQLKRYQDKIEIMNVENPESGVIGYNYYVSYQSGGAYTKINPILIEDPSFTDTEENFISKNVDTVGTIRVTTTTEEIITRKYYSCFFTVDTYNKLVSEGLFPDVGFNQEIPFYFIVTAIIYDESQGLVTESTHSPELEGHILNITTGIMMPPERTQSAIILTYSQELLAGNAGIDTKPGTVIRDLLDPISEEQARMYVIQNFLFRQQSISALLDFDDADGDGESDPFSESVEKRALQVALNIENESDVQSLIDAQFDALGSNVNVTRREALRAEGVVVFYVLVSPIRDMVVNEGSIVATLGDLDQGIPAQNYRTTTTMTLSYVDKDSYYNASMGRYELSVPVISVDMGEDGNTDSFTIRTVTSGADTEFSVENPEPISFGADRESNRSYAGRIELALFADTGTEGGYARVAKSVPGVHGVRVEKAKDELMRRDYDSLRNEHIGGKVDIYIQGRRSHQVSDTIAFSYESVSSTEGSQMGEIFQIISTVSFQFRSQNPRVTAHTPIFEVSRVYNSTRGAEYDLSGYQIIGSGDTIDLNEVLAINARIGLSSVDVIRVDYRYRSSDIFIMSRQPVDSIVSVVGQISGVLTSDNYELVKLQDPLESGASTISQDGVRIKYANNLPVTEFQSVVDEHHVLIEGILEPLNLLGPDINTIVVKSLTGTVYVRDVDYSIFPGSYTEVTNIRIISIGAIQSGEEVLISYDAIENFEITYSTNELLNDVQSAVDKMKHACADVIVKVTIENSVDFILTVVPSSGVLNTSSLSAKMRTALSNYISQLGVGVSLTQSEVIHVLKKIPSVDYIVIPLIRMAKADGSFIIRDDLGSPIFEIYNDGLVRSYITTIPVLTYSTIRNGGPDNLFRGIFEDTMPLVLQSDPLNVSGGPGRGFIMEDGKIVVSTRNGDLPELHKYQASYYVYGETGSSDINVAPIEYLKVGEFSVSFDTPRSINRQSF